MRGDHQNRASAAAAPPGVRRAQDTHPGRATPTTGPAFAFEPTRNHPLPALCAQHPRLGRTAPLDVPTVDGVPQRRVRPAPAPLLAGAPLSFACIEALGLVLAHLAPSLPAEVRPQPNVPNENPEPSASRLAAHQRMRSWGPGFAAAWSTPSPCRLSCSRPRRSCPSWRCEYSCHSRASLPGWRPASPSELPVVRPSG